ncbi:MAG: hypothetical protein ACLFP1_08495 [Candidatus Goldiibacteriota bacterium]
MNKIKIIAAALMISAAAVQTAAGPYEFAEQYADADQNPVMVLSPAGERAVGYTIPADLDGDGTPEMVVPYIVRQPENYGKEGKPKQIISVDVVKGSEKTRGVIEAGIDYIRDPVVYLTVKKPSKNRNPEIFLLVNDGAEKGMNKKFLLAYSGFDPEKENNVKRLRTFKMPWEFIFRRFSGDPVIVVFETELKKKKGTFYIYPPDESESLPEISEESLENFKEELAEYRKDIAWTYAGE